ETEPSSNHSLRKAGTAGEISEDADAVLERLAIPNDRFPGTDVEMHAYAAQVLLSAQSNIALVRGNSAIYCHGRTGRRSQSPIGECFTPSHCLKADREVMVVELCFKRLPLCPEAVVSYLCRPRKPVSRGTRASPVRPRALPPGVMVQWMQLLEAGLSISA